MEKWAWRAILTILFGAIGAGLLATIFGLTAKSTILRVYWIVVGGLTIKEAWREYQEDRKGALLYMVLGGVAILNSLLGFLGLKLL